jgi:hypothetical protein
MQAQFLRPKHHKSDAYVIYAGGELRVRPAAAVVKAPDLFDICNLTQKTFNVDVSGAGGGDPFTLGPGEWKAVPLAKIEGVFEYTVSLDGDPTVKARGDSDPVIIIDPPGA